MSTYVDLPYGYEQLSTLGVIYKPNIEKGIELDGDADFSGGWSQADSDNAENIMLRTGYLIPYAGCPLIWCSKLQTKIFLSIT